MAANKNGSSDFQAKLKGFWKEPEGHLSDELGLWVDLALIDDNPFQPRGVMNEGDLEKLEKDFDKDGQLQPALGRPHPTRPNAYQLAYGHQRKETVKRGANAGIRQDDPQKYIGKLRLEVRELTDEEMLRIAISENARRNDVSVLDNARAFANLRQLTTERLRRDGTLKAGADGLAPWRTVADEHGGNFRDMHRIAQILELPAAWLRDFETDRTDPGKFVFNSRHGRLLVELAKDEKLQKSIYGAIKRERLSAADAERRARETKKMQQPALNLEIQASYQKQIAQEAAQSREDARETNRTAVATGTAHLRSVSDAPAQTETMPPASTRASAERDEAPSNGELGISVSRGVANTDALLGHLAQSRQQVEIAATAARDMKFSRGARARVLAEIETIEIQTAALRAALENA